MKHFLAFLLFSFTGIYANDGAFFASGNQLIPISETDISVKKEILSLKKLNNKVIEVTVYYEFFNPKEAKEIVVGFEAFSPAGDVDGTPVKGEHPYMRNFTVLLNDQHLKYNIAYVDDSSYVKNGMVQSKNLTTLMSGMSNVNEVDFYYVYHFKAKFKKGLNKIKHTYIYDVSGSVDYNYDFQYVLTAANRWGNKEIDDFTLNIDMGEFETFSINKSFFNDKSDWKINGIGKTENIKALKNSIVETDALKFHIQKGNITFKKNNFKPKGELFVYSQNPFGVENFEWLPYSYYLQDNLPTPKNDFQMKVLKNLAFARRGFIFKSADLKKFYESMDWYIANPEYVPDLEKLNPIEKDWMAKWK